MIELTAQELAFGKKLAHVDKEVRDQAVGKLNVILSQESEFTYMDMLRQWKALFYCFWLSDKPLVQQELSWDISNMILACKGANRVLFVRAFWETICREWFDIDKHRIDKYLLLTRRMIFFTFKSMEQSGWDEDLVAEYLKVITEFPASPTDPKIPNSTRTHVADVYIDELVRLRAGQLEEQEEEEEEESGAAIPVAALLEPFMRFIGSTTIRHLPPIIQEKVFENTVVRIAEAEDQAQAEDSSDGEEDADVLHDNQIEHETLDKVQFLMDSIPEIKKRIMSIAGEESMRSLGRKRLHALYQTLCDTFPDEENDIVFGKQIIVREPIGAQERKIAEKFKRKKVKKMNERKEKWDKQKQERKERKELKAMIDTGAVDFDVNALERQASAEEEKKFQQDIAKIREMEKRAGFGTTENSGDRPKSNKEKRVQKKKKAKKPDAAPLNVQEDMPNLVPISEASATRKPTNVSASATNGGAAAKDSAWVVRDKSKKAQNKPSSAVSNGQQKRRRESEPSLLAEAEMSIVVKDKKPQAPTAASTPAKKTKVNGDTQTTPKNKAAAHKDGKSSSEKKRLTWALERNSVKRFLKKVPMLPSAEPALATPPDLKLKSALRKESAYSDAPSTPKSPLKPLLRTPTKQENRVSVNGHASTPARRSQKAKARR
ncbi:Nop52-domain-containing protein [Martensiomyces pterosporus]|nr:Nop52-domain-containing protein [Martensiomyces pterosporus]